MKAVVVYKSKTGFAKQYAEWIAEELSADLFEASAITVDKLDPYDTVVYGGGLYAVGINGLRLITRNLGRLAGKKIAIFATGAAPGRLEEISSVLASNFTPEQRARIHFFYLRGGFDASKLGVVDRILMTLLKWKLLWKNKQGELLPDERGMLNAYDRPLSFVKKSNINPLIEYVKSE